MVYRFKMMFTADDKIKSLRQLQLKVTVYESFFKNFHSVTEWNWTRRRLDCLLAKVDKYGMAERVQGSDKPRNARTADTCNVAAVEVLLASGTGVLSFCSRRKQTFRAYDAKMMRLTTRLTIFERQ